MIGELGGENNSVERAIHHSAGEFVFDRQDLEGGSRDGRLKVYESALTLSKLTEPPSTRPNDLKPVRATDTLTKHPEHMISVTET